MSNIQALIPSLTNYRNHLKALKSQAEKNCDKLRKKVDPSSMQKVYDLVKEKSNYFQGLDEHQISQVLFSYYNINVKGSKTFEEIAHSYEVCKVFIANIIIYIASINDFISAIKNNDMVYVLEIDNNIVVFNELWRKYHASLKTISEVIGLTILRNVEKMDENPSMNFDYPDELRILRKYYKDDGSFVSFDEQTDCSDFNEYIEKFHNALSRIQFIDRSRCIIFSKEELKEASEFTSLYDALTELLRSESLAYKEQKVSAARKELLTTLKKLVALKEGPKEPTPIAEEPKPEVVEEIKINSEEALKYLQEYYENGFIIAIPDDIDEFSKYLNACDISVEEKIFIWNTLLSIMSDEIIPSLDDNNLRRYLRVLQIYKTVNFNSELYFRLSEERSGLLEAKDLLKEASDEQDAEIIREDQTETIDKLEAIISGYLKNNALKNNIIFLTGENARTYIESDLNLHPELESEFYNLTLGVTTGASYLERLENVKDTNLPLYVASGNQANLYLVEIVIGVYVIIGISTKDEKKKNMQNRAFKNKDILEQSQETMFDYFRKVEALSLGSETYQRIRERNN